MTPRRLLHGFLRPARTGSPGSPRGPGSRRGPGSPRSSAAGRFAALLLLAPLVACGSDAPTDPGTPEPPVPAPIVLETSGLLPGGQGVLVSVGFAAFELIPAVDAGGAAIPGRWTNFRVTIDGAEVDSRRLEPTRIEFDVPVQPAGDVTIQAETPAVLATMDGRVRGLLTSRRVDDCAANDFTTLASVGDQVVLSLFCPADEAETDWRLGYAAVRPGAETPEGAALTWFDGLFLDDEDAAGMRTAVIHPGPSTRAGHFVARRPGPSSEPLDMWLWRAGSDPAPVEPRTCFPDGSGDDVTSAVADLDGACLAFQSGFLRRDATPIAECCNADGRVTFVLSGDGSAALRRVEDLVVFGPDGRIDFRIPYGRTIEDVRFSLNGDRVFVAVAATGGGAQPAASFLDVRDRVTSELLQRLEFDGRVGAIAAVDDRLWLAREPSGGGPFVIELYDQATLELERTLRLPREAFVPPQDTFTGEIAVLQQSAERTRLHLTSVVGGIVRSDVIEVF